MRTRPETLLLHSAFDAGLSAAEVGPLVNEGGLQETQLVDIRFDVLWSNAALLFDTRTALQIDRGNVAVLVLRGVRELTWEGEARAHPPTAWNVVEASPSVSNGLFHMKLSFFPLSDLRVGALSAEFYLGSIPALPDEPPDYSTEDEAFIRDRVPRWDADAVWEQFQARDSRSYGEPQGSGSTKRAE